MNPEEVILGRHGGCRRAENQRMTREWLEWLRGYDEDSSMADRLRVVQDCVRAALVRCPPGTVRVISACAGDGRDLIGALVGHARAPEVQARLVELSAELVAAGRERAAREGLLGVEFQQGDASTSNAYAGAVPADIVLWCGVWGNVSDVDVRETIRHLPELCASDATVIWTRGRFEPDLTPTIRGWFAEAGFEELTFVTIVGSTKSVGAHRLVAAPMPFRPEVRLFTFLPREERPSTLAEARNPRPTENAPP
jgi:Putative methyltransferase